MFAFFSTENVEARVAGNLSTKLQRILINKLGARWTILRGLMCKIMAKYWLINDDAFAACLRMAMLRPFGVAGNCHRFQFNLSMPRRCSNGRTKAHIASTRINFDRLTRPWTCRNSIRFFALALYRSQWMYAPLNQATMVIFSDEWPINVFLNKLFGKQKILMDFIRR